MRKVVRLDMNSVLRLFAVFYAVIGLYVATKAAISGDTSVECPFGWAFPMLHFYIFVTVTLPQPAKLLTLGIIVITSVFYALTGLITGGTMVIAYNLMAKVWPLFSAQVESEPKAVLVELGGSGTASPSQPMI
jgi:hypothetical protein